MKREFLAIFILLITVGLFFGAKPSLADAFECKAKVAADRYQDIIEGVEYEYDGIKEFYARFFQKSYLLGLDRTEVSKGEVFFKKPGKMKWSYSQPEEQLFVADGQQVWFYQPALKQVTLGDFDSSFRSDMPVSFLIGIGNIREQFFVEDMCDTEEGIKISLKPKNNDGSLGVFRLLVRKGSYATLGAQIGDYGGNETSIGFISMNREMKIDDKEFTFVVPKGIDVIDHRTHRSTIKEKSAGPTQLKEEDIFAPVTRKELTEQKKADDGKK
ncbi:MAG: outer membrane lipoprotein carrier protein LolA [Deltaproteobacteria bacterium]|nr:outer membrane lipoprotein carrier protein LolA [Deltaproteobacteria bacterium]